MHRSVLSVILVLFATQLACSASLSDEEGVASEPLLQQNALATPTGSEVDDLESEATTPALLEPRRLNLEWPAAIRVGDSELVYLTIGVDDRGNLTPTAIEAGNRTQGETVFIPNLYDTHDILVEARLEIAGVELAPTGEIVESLKPGQSVQFVWSVRPQSAGSYRGVIWVHVLLVPRSGSLAGKVESRQVLSAQAIEFHATNFLGLSGVAARVLGGVGTVVGSIFGLDNVLVLLWRRLKKIRNRASIIDLSE